MPQIYYETANGEVHQFNEISHRLLVYVYLHKSATVGEMVDSIGAPNEPAVHARIENQLQDTAAGLVEIGQSAQTTFDRQDHNIYSLVPTESGEEFVRQHRAEMSMPADVAELAKEVASLRIKSNNFRTRIQELEQRIRELEND